MDIQALKLSLMHTLLNTERVDLLQKWHELISKDAQIADGQLSATQLEALDKRIVATEMENLVSRNEVHKRARKAISSGN